MPHARYVVCLLAALFGLAASAAPTRPQRDDQVLETLPRRVNDPLDAKIFGQQRELAAKPGDFALATSLARDHLQRFRRDADPRDLGQAEAALEPWLKQAAPPPAALVLRASVLQSNHLFGPALADLDRVLRLQPGNAQARIIQASILQVQGKFDAAKRACGTLVMADGAAAGICLANVAAVSGRPDQAIRLLHGMARQLPDDSPLAGWLMTSEAETLDWMGEYTAAEQTYRRALAAHPRDSYLKTAWSDFLLDRHRPQEVIALLTDDTRNDNLLLRLALAEKQAGTGRALSTHIEDLASRFAASAERGDRVHMREEARFHLALLNDPQGALKLALANWVVQKEVADCRILMEAALAAHQPLSAKPALDWFHQSHLGSPILGELAARLDGHGGVPAQLAGESRRPGA